MDASSQNGHLPADKVNLQVANTFLSALKNNEWTAIRSILDENASWSLPGKSTLSGMAEGADAIIRRAQGLKGFGVNFQLKHILYGLHGFTLSLHNTAKRGDLILDEHVAIVCQTNNGKINAMATYLSDVDGINRFFVPGIVD